MKMKLSMNDVIMSVVMIFRYIYIVFFYPGWISEILMQL